MLLLLSVLVIVGIVIIHYAVNCLEFYGIMYHVSYVISFPFLGLARRGTAKLSKRVAIRDRLL